MVAVAVAAERSSVGQRFRRWWRYGGVSVTVGVLVMVGVAVGVFVFVGVGVKLGSVNKVEVGSDVDEGRGASVSVGSPPGVMVQVGGSCLSVEVTVGSTNGGGGSANGFKLELGSTTMLKKIIANTSAAASVSIVRTLRTLSFIVRGSFQHQSPGSLPVSCQYIRLLGTVRNVWGIMLP